jgi:ketosteroid isomerase-like protein
VLAQINRQPGSIHLLNDLLIIDYLVQLLHHFKKKSMYFPTKTLGLLLSTTLFFTACSEQSKEESSLDLNALKTEIQAKEDAFAAAEKAKDADAVVAYYSDDAVSYNRNQEPISGKAAIRESIAKRIASDSTGNLSTYKVVDLFADGNLLVEIGSFSSRNPAGEEKDRGHYLSVFQKRDGKYVCIRDMNVSSLPEKK